ncbi:MAG: hypothetical protein LLG01_09735 [Planctomycetaceae bacterium]|nr:hypothetical protein [Planctomycetaceae bacterium]
MAKNKGTSTPWVLFFIALLLLIGWFLVKGIFLALKVVWAIIIIILVIAAVWRFKAGKSKDDWRT